MLVGASGSTAMQQPLFQPLPPTYQRLVAKQVGRSFREVATVVRLPMPAPGNGEVGVGCQLLPV